MGVRPARPALPQKDISQSDTVAAEKSDNTPRVLLVPSTAPSESYMGPHVARFHLACLVLSQNTHTRTGFISSAHCAQMYVCYAGEEGGAGEHAEGPHN